MMKFKLTLLALALLWTSQVSAKGFNTKPKQDVFLTVALGNYTSPAIGYEALLENRKNSIVGELSYSSSGGTGYGVSSLGLGAGYRWWLTRPEKLAGFFAGPKVYIHNYTASYDLTVLGVKKTESASSMLFGAGGEGGYQWIIDKQMMVNLGAEMRFLAGNLNLAAGAPSVAVGGFGIGLKASIGYAF